MRRKKPINCPLHFREKWLSEAKKNARIEASLRAFSFFYAFLGIFSNTDRSSLSGLLLPNLRMENGDARNVPMRPRTLQRRRHMLRRASSPENNRHLDHVLDRLLHCLRRHSRALQLRIRQDRRRLEQQTRRHYKGS